MDAHELLRDWRTAWTTFLEAYFDGGSHTFGGSAFTFPNCEVTFNRPQFGEPLSKPQINIQQLAGGVTSRKAKVGGGIRKTSEIPTILYVYTTDKGRVWDANDNIQNLLEVAINGAAAELHALGVKPIGVGNAVPLSYDTSHEMQVSQRIVDTKLEIDFGIGS